MPPTKRGIYHNLKESKYVVSNGDTTLFFSSRLYLTKFLDGYKENRIRFTRRFKNTIESPHNLDTLADISFYKRIEKRGFYVLLKGVVVDWKSLHLYALEQMTEPNSKDWHEIQRRNFGG